METLKLKKKIKIILTVALIMWLFSALLVYTEILNVMGGTVKEAIIGVLVITGITIFLAGIAILYVLIFNGSLAIIKKGETMSSKDYVRNIPEGIPATVASLLIDYYIDNERDYIATLASIISKGYAEIDKNGNVAVIRKNTDKLFLHEKFVYEALSKGEEYNDEEFKKKVREDALNLGVIEERPADHDKETTIAEVLAGILFISFVMQEITNSMFWSYILLGVIVFLALFFVFCHILSDQKIYSATEKSYFKRTKKGTEIAKEVAGLKKFLHDYTYLKEKDIEDTILYDEYIAYAIALGEAKTVEKILIENDKYQNLIKHRVTWWELLNEDDKKYRY